MNKNIIVTGASGYIGGATCIELKNRGYTVLGIDQRPLPEHLDPYLDAFEHCCFTHLDSTQLLGLKTPYAVVHCAGTSLVGPSMEDPELYFGNNVLKTLQYLAVLRRDTPSTKFIFSSSASVYGEPETNVSLTEGSKSNPISPYGESKLMVEKILEYFYKAYKLKYVSLRYFNACGAVKGGLHGQEPDATHIFAKIFEAIKEGKPFRIYGNDYPTRDGTCIRDYVHVSDIAKAHVLAIEKGIQGIYNIGSDKGYSNLEILDAVRYWNRHIASIPLEYTERRFGDPARLIANPNKLYNETGWHAENDLQTIIKDLHDWYNSDNYAKRPRTIIPL